MLEEQEQGTCLQQPCSLSTREQAAATVHAIFGGPAALPADLPKPVWGVWQEFARQQQAFDYIDQQPAAGSKHLRVYSQEYGAKGQRNYIVSSPDMLWEMYSKLEPPQRHLYEIIREGRPCHLYFDLEYDLAANPHVDGDAQVMLLVQEVVSLMKDRLGVTVDPDRDVVELDSTTPVKFSRHVIIQLRRAWAHVGHVHAFVRLLLEQLHNKRQQEASIAAATRTPSPAPATPAVTSAVEAGASVASITAAGAAAQQGILCTVDGPSDASRHVPWVAEADEAAAAQCTLPKWDVGATAASHTLQSSGAKYAHFWVYKQQSQQREVTTLIDTAVYTRNRAFRLYLSSKFGKTQQLCATRRFLVGQLLAASKDVVCPAVQPKGAARGADNACAQPKPATAGSTAVSHAQSRPVVGQTRATAGPQQGVAGQARHHDQSNAGAHKPTKKLRTGQNCKHQAKTSGTPSLFTLIAHASSTSANSDSLVCDALAEKDQTAVTQQQSTTGQPRWNLGRSTGKLPCSRQAALAAVGMHAPARTAQWHSSVLARDQHSMAHTSEGPTGQTHGMHSVSISTCARGLLLSKGEEACISQHVLWASLVTHTAKCEGIKLLTMFLEDEAQQHTGVVRLPGQAAPLPRRVTACHADIKPNNRSMSPGPTPWPSLNTFVECICAQTGQAGHVGGWSITSEPHMETTSSFPSLLLSIKGNRWCDNVQRQHRSNGVYFIVNVCEGVWAQGCCDPDCWGFRSPTLPLPQDVWEQLQQHFASRSDIAAAGNVNKSQTYHAYDHTCDTSHCNESHPVDMDA